MKIYEGGCPYWLQAHRWSIRLMWDRQIQLQQLQLDIWSGMAAEAPGSSSCSVSPWGLPSRSPWRCRQPGGHCSARPDSKQRVSTTGGGQCGRYRGSSWGSLYNVSLVPFCHAGQWRVYHSGLSCAILLIIIII